MKIERRIKHKLSNINPSNRIGDCLECGVVYLLYRYNRNGKITFRCGKAQRAYQRKVDDKRNPYKRHKTKTCSKCGFVAEDICQLDVHHKDGNHSNNALENLKTVCANCHRLIHRGETKRRD
jgi:5-methylcytosine-specific restriction endonuclease McrA